MLPADTFLFALTFLTALGCALVAGIFLAFSSFVMKALVSISPPSGIAAMQAINVVVINPGFLGLFMGTALACALLLVYAVVHWHAAGALCLVAGSLFYILGTFGVTMVCNVPRNNALARLDPASAEAADFWRGYASSWTMWNHVRTAAALVAAALLVWALIQLQAPR
ncbi:DUF1772 domain-containing protein [Polaromonas aquatica]|uniref:anthrone oxygenase family protein n=1 Tax=Polaromonas aquatica TaxID=332657 RepID=UPI003D653695